MDFYSLLYQNGAHLGFFILDNKKQEYKYVGPFDYEDPKKIVLHTKLLIDNIASAYKGFAFANPEYAAKGEYDYLLHKISVDIIIPPFYKKEDIKDRIEEIASKEHKYSVSVYYRTDFQNRIETEYKNIGDIKTIKPAGN